jgi:crossover junction endodeoxyribonuclease RusA
MTSPILRFTVPGTPVPKQRARRGKGGRHYTPAKTRGYETTVLVYAYQAIAREGRWPWPNDQPCAVTVRVFWPDKRRRDLDNTVKAITDAMNRNVYRDDSQIIELRAFKTMADPNPRAEVEVRMVDASKARTGT